MGEVSIRARRLLLAAAVFGFLVSAGLFSSLDNRRTRPAAVLVLATTAFGVLIHSLIRHQFMMGETVVRSRIALFGGVIAVGVGLLIWWSQVPEAANGFGFWGGVLVFIGLGLAVAEARRSKWASNRFGFGFLAAAVLLLVLAFVLMAAGVATLLLPLLLLGTLSLFVALTLLSAVCNRRLKHWPLDRTVVLWMIGVVLFAGAVAVVRDRTGIGGEYLLPFALGLLGFMIATASRSNGDAAVVIIGVMVLFAATPTPEPGPRAPTGARPAVVVLGDSFSSGEGAEQYFVNTNVKEGNTCRRAPTAYGHRLVAEDPMLPVDLVFFACSGAKAAEVYEPVERSSTSNKKGLNQVALARDELSRAGIANENVPFVLLSIGGNDSFFGVIAQACLAPVDCSTLGPAWRANLRNLAEPLRGTYRAVQAAFPGAPILVVPYPVPIAAEKCDWTTFTAAEHRFLHGFTLELNSVIAGVAAEPEFSRLHYVDTMPPALLDAQLALCNGDPDRAGVNFLAVNGVGGLLESSVNPSNWIHNSMHPNERGHEVMRDAVMLWLNRHPEVRNGRPAASRSAAPRPVAGDFGAIDASARCVDVVLGPPPADGDVRSALEECTNDWTLDEVRKFGTFPGSLLLLMILTAWVAGLASVRLTRIAGAAVLAGMKSRRHT